MNWTGGSLQRHSKNAQRSVVKRQKEHFAKARTTLQNGSNVPAVPFCPSYLRPETMSIGGQLPPFGMGSVRHVGHSKRLRTGHSNDRSPRENTVHQAAHKRTYDCKGILSSAKIANTNQLEPGINGAGPSPPAKDMRPSSPNGTPVDDLEQRLLEANRRRLLQQRDWAGLGPSRPVKMHFASIREKQRIGKRRKVSSRSGIRIDTHQLPRSMPHHGRDAYRLIDMHHGLDAIKVRIGTEALASQSSAQPSEHAMPCRPEDNRTELSDPMLFDHEDICSSQGEVKAITRSVSETQASPGPLMHDRRNSPSVLSDLPYAGSRLSQRKLVSYPREGSSSNDLRDVLTESQLRQQSISPSFRLLAHGTHEPFRLTFDSSERTTETGNLDEMNTLRDKATNGTTACSLANARSSGSRHVESREDDQEHSSANIDDRAWTGFASIPHTSSNGLADSLSQVPGGYAERGYAGTQYATVGDRTYEPTSSPIFASLPSVRSANEHLSWKGTPSLADKGGHSATGYQSHGMDESERLWRTFVFADIDELAAGSMHDRDTHSPKQRMTLGDRSSKKTSCVAVASSASSVLYPIDQNPQEHRRSSDTVQIAAKGASAPNSFLGAKSRPDVCTRLASSEGSGPDGPRLQDLENGSLPQREDSDFGHDEGRSVPPGSLFNNASHDTFSSGTIEHDSSRDYAYLLRCGTRSTSS
ncbi:uncharacterized protein EI97DRAFT_440343 [Westerdykella ornata]|uniref:Uncharacterized protein n=1 Tax=Westerdykella ornata TaxID=318751 RepID=A0A6A6JUW2_WESOR|nr:uncharacterized protein EI97DRAFT_440343 [Westerdykella ornata]KAF2278829.1 hypothetical protein EI97DRAFT_440343 [Westerdykella ornata]